MNYLLITYALIVLSLAVRSYFDYRYPYRGPEGERYKPQLKANAFVACMIGVVVGIHCIFDPLPLNLPPSLDRALRLLGVAVAVTAAVIKTWPRAQSNRRASWGVPRTAPEWHAYHELVTDGAYRYVRHPYYLGVFLTILAVEVTAASYLMFVYPPFMLASVLDAAVEEERLLTNTYGDAYRDYRNRSWRLIPFIH